MRSAWKRVKANKGAAGIDKISVEEFPAFAHANWEGIRQALADGSYRPSPVRRVEIPKAGGKGKRPLGIPTVTDRVIQQAITQVLVPVFDPDFSESSYGYRPARSAQQAARKIQKYKAQGYRVAVEIDLSKFFDTVNHDVLMSRVSWKVRDKRVLKLIGKYLRAGVVIDGEQHPTWQGVPQGGPLSPLLSNILLHDLDCELEKRGHKFVRYADDFTILVKSPRAGERVMKSITRFLERKLKLKVNQQKSSVRRAEGCSFLGFRFQGKHIAWTEATLRDFKHQLRRLTGRSWGVSIKYRIHKLNEYIRGWMNYFGIANVYNQCVGLDHWLRRRIRMCIWKQWRYARTKVRELRKLGTPLREAIRVAMSRKAYWCLAKTLQTHTGMTNKWMQQQLGLVSIRDCWVALHYPIRNA
jgi:RNA-directed DNA polymerase